MSVVNHYFCDICRKEFCKTNLYRFKMSKEVQLDDITSKEYETEFDICGKCLKKISKQIKKERD